MIKISEYPFTRRILKTSGDRPCNFDSPVVKRLVMRKIKKMLQEIYNNAFL
jgi:hypothetical protein